MDKHTPEGVVLSVAPGVRGIGYVIFEKVDDPIDWGIKTARIKKNTVCERHVESLIKHYRPDVLVIEDLGLIKNRERAAELLDTLETLAAIYDLKVSKVSKNQIHALFESSGGTQQLSIAKTIASWFPALENKIPKYRKPWMPKDHNMVLFEAFALGLTHYYQNN